MTIMRDYTWLAVVVAVAAGLLMTAVIVALLGAWDDEPTQVEAEEQFCDDVGVFLVALGDLRDVDSDTSIEEFQESRENARIAYDNMIASAQEVAEARVDDLQEANDDLKAAVGVDDDATLQEARDSIQDEADEVSKQISQLLNDVNCGSGQGAQENSDE
jgi:hypothetical protein